jgi:glycosyltransferase involved in cell wall biosynthesis
MKRLAIASHVALINGKEYDGIGNAALAALSTTDIDYTVVRHSMEGGLPSVARDYKHGEIVRTAHLGVIRRPGPLRYLSEMIMTVLYFTFRKKVDVYVGIDPLNAFAAVLLKKLHRVDTCIFYTPDYSPRRFGNKTLNNIYHAIDRYCVRQADEVWCVSMRIQDVRRKMGLSDSKNILVPNVPPAKFDHFKANKHDKFALTTNGIVGTQLDNAGVMRAIAELKPKYPKLRLVIIGNGPDEQRLQDIAKDLDIAKQVEFTGRLPLERTLERTSKAGIGLALYTGEWVFNAYGDSTKCREFFNFGLPVISTDTHATVPELRAAKAGIVVEQNVVAYKKAITEILENYDVYARASQKLGEKYTDIHRKLLTKLVEN